jgi:RNA polymerase sigma-70 factor (ECF subfamily)
VISATLAAGLAAPRRHHDGRTLDDAALVRELQRSDDDELFFELVSRHKERVFRLAASVLGPHAETEAEDLTQEVFLQVYRKLASFQGRSSFATWLYRLTYNRAVERCRLARHRRPHVGETVLASMCADEVADPHHAAQANQRRRAVLACLEQLPEAQRSAVYLHYWLDRPVAEIAELLGRRPGTVKSMLHRARQRLARLLGPEHARG